MSGWLNSAQENNWNDRSSKLEFSFFSSAEIGYSLVSFLFTNFVFRFGHERMCEWVFFWSCVAKGRGSHGSCHLRVVQKNAERAL